LSQTQLWKMDNAGSSPPGAWWSLARAHRGAVAVANQVYTGCRFLLQIGQLLGCCRAKTYCARSCEPGSQCRPNECIFGVGKLRGVWILE
jgi:hypothetical protein